MRKIVVIDDDQEMGRLLKTLFELEGFVVDVVAKYEEVMSAVQEAHPDVVLLDVHLQGKDTMGLMREMRQDDTLATIPVVMTSGMDVKEECMKAGATEFVVKPFLPSQMTQLVTALLS
ncbi:MAG: response regulator [Anaerolineae bacterium]|nr:response regulator [Anaerolineae bacterium]